jgi:hypothetical protein
MRDIMTDHDFIAEIIDGISRNLQAASSGLRPLPADRWVARSALQKAVRRGDAETAHRAAITLVQYDPRSFWRAMVIIALEDVGIGAFHSVCEVIALARSAASRDRIGCNLDLAIYATGRLAEEPHCQAACDLLMRATNDPALEQIRVDVADAQSINQLDVVGSLSEPITHRAIALLALLKSQPSQRAGRVASILEAVAGNGLLAQAAGAAWRVSGNEMALLFPLIARQRSERDDPYATDDQIPPSPSSNGIPLCSLDQFTRLGKPCEKLCSTK